MLQQIKTSAKPGQEDFGWNLTFVLDGTEYCVVVGFQPNDPESGDCWIGWVERRVGFLGSILGGRNRGISPEAIALLDKVLRSSPEIRDLIWRKPEELLPSPHNREVPLATMTSANAFVP